MSRPIEIFVITRSDAEAWDLYQQTWDAIQALDQFNDKDFNTGHIDELRMVCMGYRPYRIRFGTESTYDDLEADTRTGCINGYHVISSIKSCRFRPQHFVKSHTRFEVKMRKDLDPNKINITIPIAYKELYRRQRPREVAHLRNVEKILRDIGVPSKIKYFDYGRYLAVGDYVKITMIFGNERTQELLNSKYDGTIMTFKTFVDQKPRIVDLIARLYKKYRILDE